jgi:AcrR family transcriptional regulator
MSIADEEGLDAVTMRRVASELGAGTMTLYHYVRSKDELIALVIDRLMGELVIPEAEMPGEWREAFAAIARRSHDAFRAHGWVHEMIARAEPEDAQMGNNGLRHFEQSLEAASLTGLPPEEQLELIAFLDDYVFGYSLRERQEQLEQSHGEERLEAISSYITEQLKSGQFPRVEALLAGRSPRAFVEETIEHFAGDERFERGLKRVLDGIALELERRRS